MTFKGGTTVLNDTLIKSLKPAETPKKYFDGGGLFLFVPVTGSKFWRMAYRYNKKYFTPTITPKRKGCHRGQVGFTG